MLSEFLTPHDNNQTIKQFLSHHVPFYNKHFQPAGNDQRLKTCL